MVEGGRDVQAKRIVGLNSQKEAILRGLHEAREAGHRGIWATYCRVRRRYYWKRMFRDVQDFIEACRECQVYSKLGVRDPLTMDPPRGVNMTWNVDIIIMPLGRGGFRYLVVAREALTNWVEARALRTKVTKGVCKFLLEDVFCRYGCVGRVRADRGELNADEAKEFFANLGIKLPLTTAYNPEANSKVERGHPGLVNALVKVCDGRTGLWPEMLPYVLWADRATVTRTTGYTPSELMNGVTMKYPVDCSVESWLVPDWRNDMSTVDLLECRTRQLVRRADELEMVG